MDKLNIIPLKDKSKQPNLSSLTPYFKKKYELEVNSINKGVIMGETSGNLIVLDFDTNEELNRELKIEFNAITYIVITGRKGCGLHVYFRLDNMQNAKTKDLFRDGKHIGEFKSTGGYVVAADSIHPTTGNRYKALNDLPIVNTTLEGLGKILQRWDITIGDSKAQKMTKEELLEGICPDGKGNNRAYQAAIYYHHYSDNAWQDLKEWNERCCPNDPIDLVQLEQTFKSAKGATLPKYLKKTKTDKKAELLKCAKQTVQDYNILTFSDNEQMTYFNGKSYETGNNRLKIEAIVQQYDETYLNGDISEIVGHIKRITLIDRDNFTNKHEIIICNDKVVDLETYTLHNHDPMYYQFGHSPYNIGHLESGEYNIDTVKGILSDTIIGKFLEDIAYKSDKTYTRLIEASALCILRQPQVFGKMYMLTGKRDNGKSIFLAMLTNQLGERNVSTETPQRLSTNRFSIANLEGKWANIVADISNTQISDTETLKNITTGDRVNAERKGENAFSFYPKCTTITSANNIPPVKFKDNAFFKRIVIVDLLNVFTVGINADTKILQKIKADNMANSAFLRTMVFTAKKLLEQGNVSYLESPNNVMKEWVRRSQPIAKFIDDNIEEADTNLSPITVFKRYKDSMLDDGTNHYSFKYFKDLMIEHIELSYDKDNKTYMFMNCKFKPLKAKQENETLD